VPGVSDQRYGIGDEAVGELNADKDEIERHREHEPAPHGRKRRVLMRVIVILMMSVAVRMAVVVPMARRLVLVCRGDFQAADYTAPQKRPSAGDKKHRALGVFQHRGGHVAE